MEVHKVTHLTINPRICLNTVLLEIISVSLKVLMMVTEPWTEASMHQAWSELSYIEREQERYMGLRSDTLKELDECRQRAGALENVSPRSIQQILLQKTRTIENFVAKHFVLSH